MKSGTLILLVFTLGLSPVKGESPGSVSGIEIPGVPTITPSTPAPQQDRSQGSAAAMAMAMAAASQQKIACYMMMSEAQKEPDKSTKAMMMMMAMQMCAQADQSIANAMKNKEGQKLVSANDIPKQATLNAGEAKFGKSKVEEAEVPRITYLGENGEEDTGKDPLDDLITPLPDTNLSVFEPPPQEDFKEPVEQVLEKPEEVLATLDPIDGASVKFDETPKNQDNALGARSAFIGSAGSAGNTGGEDGKAKAADSTDSSSPSKRKRGGIRTADSGTGESSGGGGSDSGPSKNYAALLQQMLGGPGGDPRSGTASSAGGDIVDLPKDGDEDLPNLFEYASFRYRKLAYEKGKIKLKRITQVRLPGSSTIAKTSKTFTVSDKKLDSTHRR